MPTPPWNVTAVQRNGTRVEVSWHTPMHSNGAITSYEVFMTPPIPPVSLQAFQKTQISIEDAFESGKNYSFWVVAKNVKYESVSSNVATLTFDGSADINKIEDLYVIEKTNHSVKLSWKQMQNADSYIITPVGPLSYPKLESHETTSNTYLVDGLAPGTRYTFEVSAKRKNYIGKPVSITGMTRDAPLGTVDTLELKLLKDHNTAVKLSWYPPKMGNRKIKWEYAVHYALNMQDLYEGLYL